MTENKHFRIGDLLLAAEILTSEYIKDALSIYESQGLPLGKVLVLSGYLNDTQLKSALDLQYMVNDQLLEFDKAVEVMKLCYEENFSISEAFLKAKIVKPEENETNKLGQILISAAVIQTAELDDCLKANENTSLPLGHIICHRGLASQPLINRALAIQNLIRTNQIDRDHGVSSLKWATDREVTLSQLEANKGYVKRPFKTTPRIGELFSECKVLTESQVTELLIYSITQNKTFGAVLLEKSKIKKQSIDCFIEIQEMLDRKSIDKEVAISALPNIVAKGHTSLRAISEATAYKMVPNQARPLIDLLKSSGILNNSEINKDIQDSLFVNYNQVRQVVGVLLDEEILSDMIVFSALRLVDLISQEIITYEKAIVALEFAHRSQMDVEYTLYMTGVFDRTRLKEKEYSPVESTSETESLTATTEE